MSDLAESLARRVRAALGEFDDPDLPVVIVVGKLADRVREAAGALEAAREDAERWRALRELDGGEIYALLGDCDGIHPEQADAAIDRARGKAGQEVGK